MTRMEDAVEATRGFASRLFRMLYGLAVQNNSDAHAQH